VLQLKDLLELNVGYKVTGWGGWISEELEGLSDGRTWSAVHGRIALT
jgi:hypothetical protein